MYFQQIFVESHKLNNGRKNCSNHISIVRIRQPIPFQTKDSKKCLSQKHKLLQQFQYTFQNELLFSFTYFLEQEMNFKNQQGGDSVNKLQEPPVDGHMGPSGEQLEPHSTREHRACLKATVVTLFQEIVAMQEYITQHCQKFQFFKKRADQGFYLQPSKLSMLSHFFNHLHIFELN